MTDSLKELREQAISELNTTVDSNVLDKFVLKYFGRKQGRLTNVLRSLKSLDDKQRRLVGAEANEVKIEIWRLIDLKRQNIRNAGKKEFIDLTIDGKKPSLGHLHALTQVRREMQKAFQSMGFAVVELPQIESDYYNFKALNIPPEHPARDMMDTFYLKESRIRNQESDKLLLRTHISTIQSHLLEKYKPPFSAVSFGRVFRREATDARHEHTYDSCEGLLVGENISLGNLKATLSELFKQLFGPLVEIKFRISYFPFTEPSVEVLMGCIFCSDTDKVGSEPRPKRRGGKGCSVCGNSGWLEMVGSGMTHPKVYEYAGYPKDQYTGFAFGIGVSRVAMLKYNIPDIRLLYQNDQRFLHQF